MRRKGLEPFFEGEKARKYGTFYKIVITIVIT